MSIKLTRPEPDPEYMPCALDSRPSDCDLCGDLEELARGLRRAEREA